MSDAITEKVIKVEPGNNEFEDEKPVLFNELPEDVIEMVMSYLNYDEVAQSRILCLRMNCICSKILNRGFSKITTRHAALFKSIKSMLPRRESERRFVCFPLNLRFNRKW